MVKGFDGAPKLRPTGQDFSTAHLRHCSVFGKALPRGSYTGTNTSKLWLQMSVQIPCHHLHAQGKETTSSVSRIVLTGHLAADGPHIIQVRLYSLNLSRPLKSSYDRGSHELETGNAVSSERVQSGKFWYWARETLSVRKAFNLGNFGTGHGKRCQFGKGSIWEILVLGTGNAVSSERVQSGKFWYWARETLSVRVI